jgi:hypothetical protein
MTANAQHTEKLTTDLKRAVRDSEALLQDSATVVGLDRTHLPAAVSPRPRSSCRPIRNASPATESANAHPGPGVWVPILVLLAFSLAAYYLFWAKITGAWPFTQ